MKHFGSVIVVSAGAVPTPMVVLRHNTLMVYCQTDGTIV